MAGYEGARKIGASELLFKQGEVGAAAFLLIEGKVALFRGVEARPEFRHVVEGRAKAPQLLGKSALLGQAYQVSARAVSAAKVVPITQASFGPLLAKADPLLRMMLTAMLQDVVLMAPGSADKP